MILAHLHHPVKAYQRESEDNRGEKLRQSFMPSYSSHPQMEKKLMTEAAISTLSLPGSLTLSSLLVWRQMETSQHTQDEILLQSPSISRAPGKPMSDSANVIHTHAYDDSFHWSSQSFRACSKLIILSESPAAFIRTISRCIFFSFFLLSCWFQQCSVCTAPP